MFPRDIYDESALRQTAVMFRRWADFRITHDTGLFVVTISRRPNAAAMENLSGEFANHALSLTKRCL